MNRIARVALTVVVAGGMAIGVSACGGDEETTTTEVVTEAPATVTETATPTETTGPVDNPAQDCQPGEVFSSAVGECVPEDNGPDGNPCPPGEVPMADRPVCVPE